MKASRTFLRIAGSVFIGLLVLGFYASTDGATEPKAPYRQTGTLVESKETKSSNLATFAVDTRGNLLLCDAGAPAIKVITPADKLVDVWKLPHVPRSITVHTDGTIFVGSKGKITKLDKTGKVLKTMEIDPTQEAGMVTSLATDGKDLFAAVRIKFRFHVYRLGLDLENPTGIAEGFRGCCGEMDLTAAAGKVFIAENARPTAVGT